MEAVAKNIFCSNICVLKLLQDLVISRSKFLVGVGTKDRSLVRTKNSFSVKVWSERSWIMLWLCWEVYILMFAAVKFLNEDLHWFCGERAFYCWRCMYAS